MTGYRCIAACLLLLAGLPVPAARAQGVMDRGSGPIAIEADQGIEWRRNDQMYIATGNAKATRGDVTVTARKLIARYRERPANPAAAPAKPAPGTGPDGVAASNNATDIYRLEAEGDVVIRTPTETATGERGVYDLDQSVLVLTGRNLRLDTKTDRVLARDSLEYWEARKLAVARGDASATRDDRKVLADVLTAHIAEDTQKKESHISQVDAFGNVRIETPAEYATGAKGVYDMDRNLATLVGNVRVTHQGRNQLNGEYADVNFNTGISRMLSGPAAGKAGRPVEALLVPGSDAPAPDAKAGGPTGSGSATPAPAKPAASHARPAPRARAAQSATPQSATPQGATPQGATPQGATP